MIKIRKNLERAKNINGITLISLVITMIIILILVGLTMIMLTQGGVVGTAKHSANKTLQIQEQERVYDMVAAARATAMGSPKTNIKTDMFKDLKALEKEGGSGIRIYTSDNDKYYSDSDNCSDNKGFIIEGNLTHGLKYLFEFDENYKMINDTDCIYVLNDTDSTDCTRVYKCIECENTKTIDIEDKHNYGEEVVTLSATCETNGMKKRTCSKCGKEEVEEIQALGHNWEEEEEITLIATCEADGEKKRTCSICEKEELEKIQALGHKQKENFSFSSQGHYRSCERCGKQMTEIEAHHSSPCTTCGYTGKYNVSYELSNLISSNTQNEVKNGNTYNTTISPKNILSYQLPETITIRMSGKPLTSGYSYNNVNGEISISSITGDIVISAFAERTSENVSFTNANIVNVGERLSANIDQSYRLRIFKFTPEVSATYVFYSNDSNATANTTDPYAYLFDYSKKVQSMNWMKWL